MRPRPPVAEALNKKELQGIGGCDHHAARFPGAGPIREAMGGRAVLAAVRCRLSTRVLAVQARAEALSQWLAQSLNSEQHESPGSSRGHDMRLPGGRCQ